MDGLIFFKACGAGKGQGEKKVLSKNTRSSCGALLIRAFLERAGERPTCSGARASKATRGDRHEEREPQQSTRQKHGIEQSTAPSRAAAARDDGSSGVRAVELQVVSAARDPKIFGLRRCLAPEAPISLPQEGHKVHRRNGRVDVQATSSTLLLVRCKGVDMDVRYANVGNSYSIMRRFTRH